MEQRAAIIQQLQPLLQALQALNLEDPLAAQQALSRDWPVESERLRELVELLREGASAGWLCPKGSSELAFGRISRSDPSTLGFSVDAVKMSRPGPGHVHPEGEIDMLIPLSGEPSFDGQSEGWVVYPPGSWHVPTVQGGEMLILYFLPNGAFQAAAQPPA